MAPIHTLLVLHIPCTYVAMYAYSEGNGASEKTETAVKLIAQPPIPCLYGNSQIPIKLIKQHYSNSYTVEPSNKGHFGISHFVLCREVVLFLEILYGKGAKREFFLEGPLLEVSNIDLFFR